MKHHFLFEVHKHKILRVDYILFFLHKYWKYHCFHIVHSRLVLFEISPVTYVEHSTLNTCRPSEGNTSRTCCSISALHLPLPSIRHLTFNGMAMHKFSTLGLVSMLRPYAAAQVWLTVLAQSSTLSTSSDERGNRRILIVVFFCTQYDSGFIEALSVLMLCAPSNCRRPFWYHTKMARIWTTFVNCPFSREKNWHKLSKVYWIWQVATVRSINHNVSALKELSCRL